MRATLNIPKIVFATFREFGIAAALRDLIARVLSKVSTIKRYKLLSLDLNSWQPASLDAGFEVVVGSPSILIPYVDNALLELDAAFLIGLPSDVAVAAIKHLGSEQLVAYGFISEQSIAISGELSFSPSLHSAYLFKFFVVKNERGKGLLRPIISALLSHKQDRSLDVLYTIIVGQNFNSLRAFRTLGFKPMKSFLVGSKSRGHIVPRNVADRNALFLPLEKPMGF